MDQRKNGLLIVTTVVEADDIEAAVEQYMDRFHDPLCSTEDVLSGKTVVLDQADWLIVEKGTVRAQTQALVKRGVTVRELKEEVDPKREMH